MTFITLLPFKCIFWFGFVPLDRFKCHLLGLMTTFHHLKKKKNLFQLLIFCEACSSYILRRKACIYVKKPDHLSSILCIHSATLMPTLVPELRLHNLGIFSLHHGRIPTSHHSSLFSQFPEIITHRQEHVRHKKKHRAILCRLLAWIWL